MIIMDIKYRISTHEGLGNDQKHVKLVFDSRDEYAKFLSTDMKMLKDKGIVSELKIEEVDMNDTLILDLLQNMSVHNFMKLIRLATEELSQEHTDMQK